MKILVCGNSHTVDFTRRDAELRGWVNALAHEHSVTNLSQAGVGEYKIALQVKSQDLDRFDAIILSHSSANRIHCQQHPVHHDNAFYRDADLIYADVAAHPGNRDSVLAKQFFERYFDLDHARYLHELICRDILHYLSRWPHLHQFHLVDGIKANDIGLESAFDIAPIAKRYPGGSDSANHLNPAGHDLMLATVTSWIQGL